MKRMIPAFLYKYRSTDSEQSIGRLLSMVENGEIFFGSSFQFNDIFDCRPVLDFRCTDEDLVAEHLSTETDAAKRIIIERRLRSIIGTSHDPRHPTRQLQLQQMFHEGLAKWGVFCAAESASNALMWSHYASSFNGVCVELRARAIGRGWEPVRYTEERPVIKMYPKPHASVMDEAILTKSDVWEYEKEWRAFGNPGVNKMREGAISRIIFGSRCNSGAREAIKAAALRSTSDIRYAEATPDALSYNIVITDLPTS